VHARFLQADDVAGLREQAEWAEADGAGAVVVGEGPLGDPVVLGAGLSSSVHRALLGVRMSLTSGRHPAVVAREMSTLDLVCGGRSVLCAAPPFGDPEALREAIELCRALWRHGVADGGDHFPVQSAVNRPRPFTDASPLVALELGTGSELPPALVGVADLLLRPTPERAVWRMERT